MLQDRQRRGDKPGAWRDAAEEQARQELGDTYELIDIGKPATIDGLIEELAIEERLDGLILNVSNNCCWCGRQILLTSVLFGVNAANFGPAKSRLITNVR